MTEEIAVLERKFYDRLEEVESFDEAAKVCTKMTAILLIFGLHFWLCKIMAPAAYCFRQVGAVMGHGVVFSLLGKSERRARIGQSFGNTETAIIRSGAPAEDVILLQEFVGDILESKFVE